MNLRMPTYLLLQEATERGKGESPYSSYCKMLPKLIKKKLYSSNFKAIFRMLLSNIPPFQSCLRQFSPSPLLKIKKTNHFQFRSNDSGQ